MKNIKNLFSLLFATAVIFSCSEDYLDVNTDPNNPTEVGPELILPVAQVYTANTVFGNRYTNCYGNIMMYSWSQSDGFSWYYDEFEYQANATFYDNIFDYSYTNTLKQYQALTNLEGGQYANYHAIADIMKAFHFQTLVDGYGDVPYSEALLRGENPTPAYDDAEGIYDNLVARLNAAIDMINNAGSGALVPGEDDAMFGGNMTMWKQLANTLKLRLLIRQSDMASKQAFIQEEINAIMMEGSGFLTADAAVNPGYLNEEGKQSPFWRDYGLTVAGETQNNGQATCASDYAIEKLESFNDPRIDFIYSYPVEPLTSGHVGVPQGVLNYPTDDSWEPEHVSLLGPTLLSGATQDAPIFTLTEALFLQTEAIYRGYMTGDAQAMYESAITASFEFHGAPDIDFYLSQPINNVGWNASSNKLEAIITQKYIALNGHNGYEMWVEYNRTGFPSDVPVSLLATTPDRPVRLAYPNSEVTSNGANVPSQPNVFNTKIFWAN